MIRIDIEKPYRIVYALCKHEYFGYLIEPHIVQLNPDGDFSMSYQRIFLETAKDFCQHLSDNDAKIIKVLDQIEQDALIKKFNKKPVRAYQFFSESFDQKFLELSRPFIEKKMLEALFLIQQHGALFLMDKDGWPVGTPLQFAGEKASVLFHFRRNQEETRYFPTIKHQGLRMDFMYKGAQIICFSPAILLLDATLYFFQKEMDGKKLQPFLEKRYIAIPKEKEAIYFERFVLPLVEKYDVYAEGFRIESPRFHAIPVLKLIFVEGGISQLQLYFKYGTYVFPSGTEHAVSVRLEQSQDEFIFYRVKRSLAWEKKQFETLIAMGLKNVNSIFNHTLEVYQPSQTEHSYAVINWLNQHWESLQNLGFEIEQGDVNKKFLFATNKINIEITENNDWFDINATVYFGTHQIPFTQLRNYILQKKSEFVLPNGEIAVIPEYWFSEYSQLFSLSESKNQIKLYKHHAGLLQDLAQDGITQVTLHRKLQQLQDFDEINEIAMPQHFKGELRSYQKAGYNWFGFLKKYQFGGCLADDMGLGKTIQTLAWLQKLKEENEAQNIHQTTLIVMPTSLIYNWTREATKFTPHLHIKAHTGTNRAKSMNDLVKFDIIITTYGIARIDAEMLSGYYFNYIVLDESQHIKNPSSKSFKAIKGLNSKFRLVLSGTPVENSVADLWAQLHFLNPGLLGTHAYFMDEFVQQIEKKKDEAKARKLQAMLKPFILRRTKEQVATELPPKTEQVFYCEMSADQAAFYEKIKAEYRNSILSSMEDGAYVKKQIQVLQGLTALRQLANHPQLIDETYESDSGKFESIVHTLHTVLANGHKVLVFSQFVKHLQIFTKYLDKEGTRYVYLDGSTKNRGEVVNDFQENSKIRLFLISLKAGGVGLNLTEADYVFILDPWWNPAVEQQAIDRAHRIGQKRSVFIYKFITRDSVEEKILALQQRKKSLANALITTEESFFKSLSKEDIAEMLS